MSNNKQQTAVDSIIEFCQKQMDNDSSIHKGVYLSIIKFCKEQITEESEIHWKTTLLMMTNNKQQTAVKLYTEEEVVRAIELSDGRSTDEVLAGLTPIQLPSDEEIDKEIEWLDNPLERLNFKAGIRWMRDKIRIQRR
jgi:hypothetical protein